MLDDNIILNTDSYKINHWNQYPKGTQAVYSYLEARDGAKFSETVLFGLQSILKRELEGVRVTYETLFEAEEVAARHFGGDGFINSLGWQHIIDKHGGRLPLRIRAVPEGLPVPNSNVLLTVENTDPECFWLTNAVESLLTHVWYPSTVATLSRETKKIIKGFLDETAAPEALGGLGFMLHDFGYRGATTTDAAEIGGAGHLVNFVGTDTLPALRRAVNDYDADLATLGFSVPATEHSIMTARGRGEGEEKIVNDLIEQYPAGILSVVADSYDIYLFVVRLGTGALKERVLARDGVFVVRPDSTTDKHRTPEELTVWIAKQLWMDFGGEVNAKGYKVLDSHVRILWGDGIGTEGIALILRSLEQAGFSAENMVFGMGGGLLQKVNRDTQRFAFKSSAQKRNGQWFDVFKQPLDATKASKPGRLRLLGPEHGLLTNGERFRTAKLDYYGQPDLLQVVFEDGERKNQTTFEAVRERAAL